MQNRQEKTGGSTGAERVSSKNYRKRMDFNLKIKQTNPKFLIRLRFGFKIDE